MFTLRNKYNPFDLNNACLPFLYKSKRQDAGLGANYYDMITSGFYNKLHEFHGSLFKDPEDDSNWNIISSLRHSLPEEPKNDNLPAQIRGLIGFSIVHQAFLTFLKLTNSIRNSLKNVKFFPGQIIETPITFQASAHMYNFLPLQYKKFLESGIFFKEIPVSAPENDYIKKYTFKMQTYVYDDNIIYVSADPWCIFFYLYYEFLHSLYGIIAIYDIVPFEEVEDLESQVESMYYEFLQDLDFYYPQTALQERAFFEKNFPVNENVVRKFFELRRKSYFELQKCVRDESFRKHQEHYRRHVADSLFDWMGGFENLERFFLNSILGQFFKTLTAANLDLDLNQKNKHTYRHHGFMQNNVFCKVASEYNLKDIKGKYFYFFWDYNITRNVGELIDLGSFDSYTYYGFTELGGFTDAVTSLHDPELVSKDLQMKLTHWIKGLKNSFGLKHWDVLPVFGVYLGEPNITTKIFSNLLYGDEKFKIDSPFYQYTQHYLLNWYDLSSYSDSIDDSKPRWKPY